MKSLYSNEVGDWETSKNVYNYLSIFSFLPSPTHTQQQHTHTRIHMIII